MSPDEARFAFPDRFMINLSVSRVAMALGCPNSCEQGHCHSKLEEIFYLHNNNELDDWLKQRNTGDYFYEYCIFSPHLILAENYL
jgi:hypothetical protein